MKNDPFGTLKMPLPSKEVIAGILVFAIVVGILIEAYLGLPIGAAIVG